MKRALLLVDHGSRRPEANAVVEMLARELTARLPDWIVRFAHMDLVGPSIAEAVDACVASSAREIVVHPLFLAPGAHSREDIPRMARDAVRRHPGLRLTVTEPLAPHPRLAEVVLDRIAEATGEEGRAVDVYYDYMSPYCYVLLNRLEDTAQRHRLQLRWKPIDFQALEGFGGGSSASPAKARYTVADVTRVAEYHGLPIQVPRPFPVRSTLAQRTALAAQEQGFFPAYNHTVFLAAWAEQRDIGDAAVLRDCVRDAGGDPDAALELAGSDAVDDAYRRLTEEADRAGVFGVPTMALGDELFFGSDRLRVLEWRLRDL